MSDETRTCIRGCRKFDRHAQDCSDADCKGCAPRRAAYGHLCYPCHRRLSQWLSGDDSVSLLWVHDWLGERKRALSSMAFKQDWQRPDPDDGPQAPLRLEIHDQQVLLSDRVYVAEERVREVFDRPMVTFDLANALQFLRGWQARIEEDPQLVEWMYGKFEETMRDSHSVAPWRAEVQRLPGLPCPECDRCNLVIYGGESDVTCRSCWMMFTRENYDRWAFLVRSMREAAAS